MCYTLPMSQPVTKTNSWECMVRRGTAREKLRDEMRVFFFVENSLSDPKDLLIPFIGTTMGLLS